jgi:long-chain fatty acid transport protein
MERRLAGSLSCSCTEIRSFFFTPVIAYAFSDQFSISVGALISIADVKIIRMTQLQDPVTGQPKPDAEVNMEGDGNAFGFTAGILFKPSNNFSVGASYRSEVKFDFEGTLTHTPATFGTTTLPAGDVKAPLTAPQNLSVGVAFMPSNELTITADFQWNL